MPKLDCGDVALDYEVSGEGAALVFIHGAFTDRRMWQIQANRFRGSRQVVTFDLRGHGATGPSRRRRYDVALFADDLERLVDGLGIERASLVGASLGGMIAQAFAQRHPTRVERLFLLSSFIDTTERQKDLPRLGLLPDWVAAFAIRACGRRRFAAYAKRRAAELGGDRGSFVAEDLAIMLIEPPELPKIYRSVFTFRAARPSGLAAPVLVACGGNEHPTMKSQARRLAELHGVPLVEIAGAGHLSSTEDPETVNDLLDRFLAGADRGRSEASRASASLPQPDPLGAVRREAAE